MKEITFLRNNYQRWMEFENLLNAGDYGDPDALAELFVRITDDLSWARTFYPGSNTEKYLNDLAARIHQEIYKNKKEKRSRILTFWTREFPLMFRKQHLNLYIAFIIFGLSCWVGVISAQNDESFVRLILGDGYVDMTLENMKDGDPLGVYKDENQFLMFFYIAINNSVVAILCIMAGLLHWIGVGMMMFRNGVMLGAFFYFLTANGFGYEAFHTVWIHGVIEIWCIVVAGAGGIALGNALWFPGAWPRGEAFKRGARDAMKIAIGLIPFFFLAAFFEGFVTRYTELSDIMRKFIIFGSLVFVIWYFILLPYILSIRLKPKSEAVMIHSLLTKMLMWLAIVLTSPITPVALAIIRVTDKTRQMSALEYLTRLKEVNPITMSRILFGMLLIFLPTIAFIGAWIDGKMPDGISFIFFCICYLGGLAMIVWAAFMANRFEEDDLQIERSSKVRDTHYESKGSSVKV
jgi:uncharacterized membrane protein SpoIIM required for sporulation